MFKNPYGNITKCLQLVRRGGRDRGHFVAIVWIFGRFMQIDAIREGVWGWTGGWTGAVSIRGIANGRGKRGMLSNVVVRCIVILMKRRVSNFS